MAELSTPLGSGSSPLANRLVEAVEAKLNELHAADGAVRYPTAARHASVAVLREMAKDAERDMQAEHEAWQASTLESNRQSYWGARSAYLRMHDRLLILADEIEKGGT